MGRKGAPPVDFKRPPPAAETRERRSWTAACLVASKAQREGLAAPRENATAAAGQTLMPPVPKQELAAFSVNLGSSYRFSTATAIILAA